MLGGIATEDERKAFRSDELLVGIVKGEVIAHRCRLKHFLHTGCSNQQHQPPPLHHSFFNFAQTLQSPSFYDPGEQSDSKKNPLQLKKQKKCPFFSFCDIIKV